MDPYFISYRFSLWVDDINYANRLYGYTLMQKTSKSTILQTNRFKEIPPYMYEYLFSSNSSKMVSCTEPSYPTLVTPEMVKNQLDYDLQGFYSLSLDFGETYIAPGTEQNYFTVVPGASISSPNFEVGRQYKIDVEYELGAMITDTNVILF